MECAGGRPSGRAARFSCLAAATAAILLLAIPGATGAATRRLLRDNVLSPNRQWSANLEWEDIGFLGILRMKLERADGRTTAAIELPALRPQPSGLQWIGNDWVGCESFIGERAAGFFFVHIPGKRGYLLDIVESEYDQRWIFSFASNDEVSSATIPAASSGRRSLFPVVLDELPADSTGFFTEDFCRRLAQSLDEFHAWRRSSGVSTLELLTEAAVSATSEGLVLAQRDGDFQLVRFSTATTGTAEMLDAAEWQSLPTAAAGLVGATSGTLHIDYSAPPEFRISVTDSDSGDQRVLLSGRLTPGALRIDDDARAEAD